MKSFHTLLLGLALALACTGCTTVTPTPADVPAAASFDGTEQNSGIVGVQPGGIFVVTAHLRARYNSLIADYGREFAPAIVADYGLAPIAGTDRWTMTPESMANFAIMVQWRRMGRASR